VDRRVRRRAQRIEQQQHFVLLDELARLLHRLGRAVAVVEEMKLILRPFTPPCSLIIFKYAAIALPITPYADAGPLNRR
jgi:hypothetical protein